MKILFRCDAGTQIGIGHLMRCLTLANALRDAGAECDFVCREHPGSPHATVTEQGFRLAVLPPPSGDLAPAADALAHATWLGVSVDRDAEETVAAIDEFTRDSMPYDWLVVDHYALGVAWETPMRSQVRHILAIDDLADREHDCDVLLDQNFGREARSYAALVPANCRLLVGLQYALLRPEFAQWRDRSLARRADGRLERLMISLGGVDADNVTGSVLTSLYRSGWLQRLHTEVIVGPTAPHTSELRRKICALNAGLAPGDGDLPRVSLVVGASNMAERLASTDLVIGAAGSSSWERCCLGVPAALLILAENQQRIAESLAQAGAATLLDANTLEATLQTCNTDSLLQALTQMSQTAASLTDGLGVSRVSKILLNGVFHENQHPVQ